MGPPRCTRNKSGLCTQGRWCCPTRHEPGCCRRRGAISARNLRHRPRQGPVVAMVAQFVGPRVQRSAPDLHLAVGEVRQSATYLLGRSLRLQVEPHLKPGLAPPTTGECRATSPSEVSTNAPRPGSTPPRQAGHPIMQDPLAEDQAALERSRARLLELEPSLIVPGHGAPVPAQSSTPELIPDRSEVQVTGSRTSSVQSRPLACIRPLQKPSRRRESTAKGLERRRPRWRSPDVQAPSPPLRHPQWSRLGPSAPAIPCRNLASPTHRRDEGDERDRLCRDQPGDR